MSLNFTSRLLISAFLIVIDFIAVEAQERRLIKAGSEYNDYAYVYASEIFKEVAESGYESEELFQKLGNSYYFNADYAEAKKWYEKLLGLNKNPEDPIYLLRYAQTLKSVGNTTESEKMFNNFYKRVSDSTVGEIETDAEFYQSIIEKSSNRYTLEQLPINTEASEYGATAFGDKLFFTSSKEKFGPVKRIDKWTDRMFYNFYEAKITAEGELVDVQKYNDGLDGKFNESSIIFTKDGNTAYFTRNNNTPKIKRDKKVPMQNLKIYRASKIDGKWGNFVDLSINGETYSNAHPTLGPSERTLYFTSNMPGSFGETDIFTVEIRKDGSLSKPRNLGPIINTRGREAFPFVSSDGELYFSSDGHFGLGGYDVFYSDLKQNVLQIVNVGVPINTAYDDFAFSINNTTRKGYISSNRAEGKGLDDIYGFIENIPLKKAIYGTVNGQIIDVDTQEPIPNAKVELKNRENQLIASTESDEKGFYTAQVNRLYHQSLVVSKEDYEGADKFLERGSESQEANFSLKKDKVEITTGMDIAKIVDTKIYFDLNAYKIRPDAELELAKIIAIMKKNPSLKIKVRSHTDSRAEDPYNMALSERRAQETIKYMVTNGVSEDRLSGEGRGETELLNHCANNVVCSKKEHAVNRRSEFIIMN